MVGLFLYVGEKPSTYGLPLFVTFVRSDQATCEEGAERERVEHQIAASSLETGRENRKNRRRGMEASAITNQGGQTATLILE